MIKTIGISLLISSLLIAGLLMIVRDNMHEFRARNVSTGDIVETYVFGNNTVGDSVYLSPILSRPDRYIEDLAGKPYILTEKLTNKD